MKQHDIKRKLIIVRVALFVFLALMVIVAVRTGAMFQYDDSPLAVGGIAVLIMLGYFVYLFYRIWRVLVRNQRKETPRHHIYFGKGE